MRVFTPVEIAKQSSNKYLGVLVAAKYARVLNEFPRDRSSSREKKLTTRSLEEIAQGDIVYHVVHRRRAEGVEQRPAVFGRAHPPGRQGGDCELQGGLARATA